MSDVAKKLQIKAGHRVLVRGAPDGVAITLPDGASRVTRDPDVALYFVTTARDVASIAKGTLPAIAWLAYPKKSSGIPSELTRDEGWDPLFARGYVGVASIAIDETWSALRVRPGTADERAKAAKLRTGMRRPGARAIATKPPAALPDDLVKAVAKNAVAKKTAASLAPSHVREYRDWIESAKKPETRSARVEKAVAMLAAGMRDRNVKYR